MSAASRKRPASGDPRLSQLPPIALGRRRGTDWQASRSPGAAAPADQHRFGPLGSTRSHARNRLDAVHGSATSMEAGAMADTTPSQPPAGRGIRQMAGRRGLPFVPRGCRRVLRPGRGCFMYLRPYCGPTHSMSPSSAMNWTVVTTGTVSTGRVKASVTRMPASSRKPTPPMTVTARVTWRNSGESRQVRLMASQTFAQKSAIIGERGFRHRPAARTRVRSG
jgi:hypothetical protein